MRVLVLPGDHIGPEVTAQAERVLLACADLFHLDIAIEHGLIGGAAYEHTGVPLAPNVVARARACDAVLLGAVGGPAWEGLPRPQRPERGLLQIRSALGLFANLRPSFTLAGMEQLSPLRALQSSPLDLMIVRELTGGIYFGEPRGVEIRHGEQVGYNTMIYSEHEIERIAHVAFATARRRKGRLTSVDKANVLEVSELWRQVVARVGAASYPDVALTHLYVDNAAMQLVMNPQQFDVLLAPNLFGDILSDTASVLPGSIGVLPSASVANLGGGAVSLYEPCHGSAPDIAGRGIANPLAAIFSVAMMLEYAGGLPKAAAAVSDAAQATVRAGVHTADLGGTASTAQFGDAVLAALQSSAAASSDKP